MGDVGCSGLTVDSVVLILQSLVSQLGKSIFLSTKNPEDAFDLYSRGRQQDAAAFTYFPDSNNENNVPGFEKEDLRYQKESIIKALSKEGFVCIGTHKSFREKTIPKEKRKRV